jgi:hypothetical protein
LVTAADITQIARIVAGLDQATQGEFRRVDCAPRATLGGGTLTAGDVVQAARYAVGLDPLTPAGGPSGAAVGGAVSAKTVGNVAAESGELRTAVSLGKESIDGTRVRVPILLRTSGAENALSFSFSYDAEVFADPEIAVGANAAGASLTVNAKQAGRLAAVLWLSPGEELPAGDCEVAIVSFRITSGAGAKSPSLAFVDAPAVCEVSDCGGSSVPAAWSGIAIGGSDSDGDGATDWQEYVAGTCASDREQYLKVQGCVLDASDERVEISWDSKLVRWYTVYLSTNLPGVWAPIHATGGDGTRKTFTTGAGVASPLFLRLSVRLQDTAAK